MDEHPTQPAESQPNPAPVYRPGASMPSVPAPSPQIMPPQIVPPPPGPSAALPVPAAPSQYGHLPAQPPMMQQAVIAKNPGVAAFLSFLWTGAGQIYNGQIGLGLALMALQVVNFILLFVLIGFLTGFATWCFSMWHAYTTAQSFNRRHGIVS